ncbi:MAG: hypothetical protein EXR95_10315 [Gemmatimonadetes bacterium]|nr:hypothetical protein [Gemmatimonadota bacterium]
MPLAQLQRVRLATVGILALVLGAGFLLGAVWDSMLDAETVAIRPDSTAVRPASGRDGRRTPIYVSVNPPLTPEQIASADAIVTHRREAVRALLAEPGIDSLYDAMKGAERSFKGVYDPRFRALIDTSRAAIRGIMTPEQAAQYDSLLAENDRRRRQDGD